MVEVEVVDDVVPTVVVVDATVVVAAAVVDGVAVELDGPTAVEEVEVTLELGPCAVTADGALSAPTSTTVAAAPRRAPTPAAVRAARRARGADVVT